MRRDLKVTFCQAARAARQGMDPNANVGYRRSCFVPSCGCSCSCSRCYYSVRKWPNVGTVTFYHGPPGRQEGARQVQRYLCIYSTVRAACRYVSACRLSTLTFYYNLTLASTLTSASLECLA